MYIIWLTFNSMFSYWSLSPSAQIFLSHQRRFFAVFYPTFFNVCDNFFLFLRFFKMLKQEKGFFESTRGQFHQHIKAQLLLETIPKAQKYNQVFSVFLRFWDLSAKKLGIKCWWNRHQVSISSTSYEQLLHTQIPKV